MPEVETRTTITLTQTEIEEAIHAYCERLMGSDLPVMKHFHFYEKGEEHGDGLYFEISCVATD